MEDHAHISQTFVVPVVVANTPPYIDGDNAGTAAEVEVNMRRYIGQLDTWVFIGEGENVKHSFDLTPQL